MGKIYYWLKLKKDFFQCKEIKKLRLLDKGGNLVYIYLKMLVNSLPNDGCIQFDHLEDTLNEELALDLDESIEDVETLIKYLEKTHLIIKLSDDVYQLPQAVESIGKEGDSAVRMRNKRERASQSDGTMSQSDVDNVTMCENVTQSKSKSERKSERKSESSRVEITYNDVFTPRLTEKQIEKLRELCKEHYQHYIDRLVDVRTTNPDSAKYNDFSTIKKWYNEDKASGSLPVTLPEDYGVTKPNYEH